MKLLFLDHQGVMYLKHNPFPGTLIEFDKSCIQRLNSILQEDPEIEICVSSDWKRWVPLATMQQFYKSQGILRSPIAYTKSTHLYDIRILAQQRAQEIQEFLVKRPEVTHWVAVDDLDMRPYLSNAVWISNTQLGLAQPTIQEQIVEKLSTN